MTQELRRRKSTMRAPTNSGCSWCTAWPAWLTISHSAPGISRFIIVICSVLANGSSSPAMSRVGQAIRAKSSADQDRLTALLALMWAIRSFQ